MRTISPRIRSEVPSSTSSPGCRTSCSVLSRDEAVALTDLADSHAGRGPPDNVASLARAAAKRQRRSRRTGLQWWSRPRRHWRSSAASWARRFSPARRVGADGGDGADAARVAPRPHRPARGHGEEVGHRAELGLRVHQGLVARRRELRHRRDDERAARRRRSAPGEPAGDEATGLSAATSIPTSEIRSVDIRVSGTDQPLAVTTL